MSPLSTATAANTACMAAAATAWLLLPTVEKSASHCRLDNSEENYTTLLYVHTESKTSSFFFASQKLFSKVVAGRQAGRTRELIRNFI
jgi:hypothetical protein